MDGLYVFNNPWAIQSMEKHTSYCAMMRLGMPIPDTWIVPPKDYEFKPDLAITLSRYARLFDLDEVGQAVGYPLFAKPYDGGGWAGVSRVDDGGDSPPRLRLERQRICCTCNEPSSRTISSCAASASDRRPGSCATTRQRRCTTGTRWTTATFRDDQRKTIIDTTLTINSFFGWEFNSCEALRQDGTWHPIDFANACPDSQVTSLHYHFPWLVAANLRWSIFCAATKRRMRVDLEWAPYFEIADTSAPYEEKLAAYAAIAHERFQTSEFESFCATYLGHLDRVVWDFFATDIALDAVRQKVATLFPAHEVDQFTALFWDRIQWWRAQNAPVEALMSKLTSTWYSPRIERDVTVVRWGTFGTPGPRVPDRRRRRRGDRALPPRRRRAAS